MIFGEDGKKIVWDERPSLTKGDLILGGCISMSQLRGELHRFSFFPERLKQSHAVS